MELESVSDGFVTDYFMRFHFCILWGQTEKLYFICIENLCAMRLYLDQLHASIFIFGGCVSPEQLRAASHAYKHQFCRSMSRI